MLHITLAGGSARVSFVDNLVCFLLLRRQLIEKRDTTAIEKGHDKIIDDHFRTYPQERVY